LSAGAHWTLVAPDWESLDTIGRNHLPFVLWPVCGRPVLSYWLEAALHEEVASITIHAQDRPHLIRSWLAQGDYWSKPIEVSTAPAPSHGAHVETMDRLPGMARPVPVVDGRELLQRWFELHGAALATLAKSGGLAIDREVSPGVWAAPGASIHPTATLSAPCWIGPRAQVGPGCRLGPDVYLGSHAVLDEDVEAVKAIVCDETFVGRHTRLENTAARGGILLNWERGVRVEIVDDFILADLGARACVPGMAERLLAGLLWILLLVPAKLWNLGEHPAWREVLLPGGRQILLKTRRRGPLLLRRQPWLRAVASGHLKLSGILPRNRAEWDQLAPELRNLFERSPAGVLSLSDLFGCHDPTQPDEWMHAAYQAGSPDGAGARQAARSFWNIAVKTPLD
jgi:hypothetical protein